jgi:hypothetical protein
MVLQYPYDLRTLQAVSDVGYHLVAHCPGCGHFESLNLKELIAQLGPNFDFAACGAQLQKVVSCLRCGRPNVPITLMEYAPDSGVRSTNGN